MKYHPRGDVNIITRSVSRFELWDYFIIVYKTAVSIFLITEIMSKSGTFYT